MSDDVHERATVALVYKLVNELRDNMRESMTDLDAKLETKFDALLEAIERLRGAVVTEPLCASRHAENEAAIRAAIKASEADRQKLWEAVHNIEKQVIWAAGIVIAATLGLFFYLLQQHIF